MKEFDQDPFGLLDGNYEHRPTSFVSPLVSRFGDISDFYLANSRLPNSESIGLRERQLGVWLNAILIRDDLCELLRQEGWSVRLAEFKCCTGNKSDKPLKMLDPFGLLSNTKATGIQTIRHIARVERKSPDYVAKREHCPDFEKYRLLFENVARRIEVGELQPMDEVSGMVHEGMFVVINDLLGYIEKIDREIKVEHYGSGQRTRTDGRTLVIFENATQSDMLMRSLEKSLMANGYLLSENVKGKEFDPDDTSGFLYVVKSKKKFEGVSDDLFKIGFTRTTVERRLAKAKTEPAYLFGHVEVVATYRCLGLNPNALESALHTFFAKAKMDITIDIGAGNTLKPQEWFRVPLKDIDRTIFLAMDSKLGDYTYSTTTGITPRTYKS